MEWINDILNWIQSMFTDGIWGWIVTIIVVLIVNNGLVQKIFNQAKAVYEDLIDLYDFLLIAQKDGKITEQEQSEIQERIHFLMEQIQGLSFNVLKIYRLIFNKRKIKSIKIENDVIRRKLERKNLEKGSVKGNRKSGRRKK